MLEWERVMTMSRGVAAVLLSVSLAMVGCSTPPTPEIESARAAVDRATESAGPYAPDSVKAAQDARRALDAELVVQDAKWFKSYDRARELAAAAKAASDKALSDASAAREIAEAKAEKDRV